jgi:hypothetical protein
MAFVVDAASVHAGQHHLAVLFIVQVDAGLYAAEGTGNFVHDIVDELIKVEDGSDLLRCFLQLLQVFYLIDERGANGNGGDGSRNGDHGIQPFLSSRRAQTIHVCSFVRCGAASLGFFPRARRFASGGRCT